MFSKFVSLVRHIFFHQYEYEMIDLPQSVASLGEAMYQSAFLSLEFRLNTGKNSAYVTIVIEV